MVAVNAATSQAKFCTTTRAADMDNYGKSQEVSSEAAHVLSQGGNTLMKTTLRKTSIAILNEQYCKAHACNFPCIVSNGLCSISCPHSQPPPPFCVILRIFRNLSGPGVSLAAVQMSTPFVIGQYNAIVAFDKDHCIQVKYSNS